MSPDRRTPEEDDRTLPGVPGDDATTSGMPRDEEPPLPDSIAQYRILRKLGEGGMGVVYEAEQDSPRRKVALKIIRGGLFVDSLSVKLFQREAHTLGRLQHPGIAAIHESGRTPDGQHYFAMELVSGKTLDDWLAGRPTVSKRSELESRLKLFRRICDAVGYAHQRGVIHRDLKPANVIVDESGEPRILDFGLARIADGESAVVSLASVTGQIKGTLPYMSPEQASGHPDAIDLRTDVYSLGVMLYEMLTGARPYDTQRESVLDAIRVILEETPTPFQKLGFEQVGKIAGTDLETIARKALEKDPDRRYQSANALSDDLERYLTNQPVLARPPNTFYQLSKLVSRNRVPFALASLVVVLSIGFGIWMSVLFAQADSARRESDAVVDFLAGMMAAVDPDEEGRDVTVAQVLDAGSKTIDDQFGEQPFVKARLMETMADVYLDLGRYDEALELHSATLEIRSEHLRGNDPAVATSLRKQAAVQIYLADYDEARRNLDRALTIIEAEYGPDDPAVADALVSFARLEYKVENYDASRETIARALAIREKTFGPDHPETATAVEGLAEATRMLGDYETARPLFERAIAIRERELGPDHMRVAQATANLGILLYNLDDYDGSRKAFERALAIREKELGPDHPDVAYVLNNLGWLHSETGNYAEARAMLERAVAIREKALGPGHEQVSLSLANLAEVLLELRDYEEARTVCERILEIDEVLYGHDHEYMIATCQMLATALRGLGEESLAATHEARAERLMAMHGSEEDEG